MLHPFGPPPGLTRPDEPFHQLCTATIGYCEGKYLWAQITGHEYGGEWWYRITPDGTKMSPNHGITWVPVDDVGWKLPTTNWFGDLSDTAVCAGRSPLSWMNPRPVDWWKMHVPDRGAVKSSAATWLWCDAETRLPFRLMFGRPPLLGPDRGDPRQLALFQMFSFTYFATFRRTDATEWPHGWQPEEIRGFDARTDGCDLVEWKPDLGMTVLMTPINVASNPLPTRVLYRWASDDDYHLPADRAQSTLMSHKSNPVSKLVSQTALMFGRVPHGRSPYDAFLFDQQIDGGEACRTLPLAQQPPNWVKSKDVDGRIQAKITDNPALCPGKTVFLISALFPYNPQYDHYQDGRYLWTWYSPIEDSHGENSRPVTFMESAAQINEGTSLALADYFDYKELAHPVKAHCFEVPKVCEFPITTPEDTGEPSAAVAGTLGPSDLRAVRTKV